MYYVFIGQHATTSTPHKITGKLSRYGDLRAFDTLAERNAFYDNFSHARPSVKCWKTNKRHAKAVFFGGMTQLQFNDYLRYVDNNLIDNMV